MPNAGRLCTRKEFRFYAKNNRRNVCIYAKKSVPLYTERWEVVFHLKLKLLNNMERKTLKVTYQEYLIIRHSLELYADKWIADMRDLRIIRDDVNTCPEIKERCIRELKNLDVIRISTQKLWANISNQANEAYKIPEQNEHE